MEHFLIDANTLPEVYHESLLNLFHWGVEAGNTREIFCVMRCKHPLQEPRISRCMFGGAYDLERYRQEMLDGILDFEVERGNWVYTYHQRFAPYLDYCINELRRDSNSRRAVISVRDNEADTKTSDPACLQSIAYRLRDGKLDCTAMFRSNDAVKAAFMNMFALVCLQERVANALGVEVGEYVHIAYSYHVYEQDEDLLSGYVRRLMADPHSTYRYKGEFDEMMEEVKPDIAELVNLLKEKAQRPQPMRNEKKGRRGVFKRSCEDARTTYIDLSFIRLVFFEGKYVGWYRP